MVSNICVTIVITICTSYLLCEPLSRTGICKSSALLLLLKLGSINLLSSGTLVPIHFLNPKYTSPYYIVNRPTKGRTNIFQGEYNIKPICIKVAIRGEE
jgi:hypothetical protein